MLNMPIGINPTVDFAFKVTFGDPDHTRVTVHLLNSVLTLPSPIKSVTFRNPFLEKGDIDDKLSVLDILAVDETGRMFNIEMQTTMPAGMNRRLLYHGARLYGGQLTAGDHYTELDPAIVVCLMSKPMFNDSQELHLEFRMRDGAGRVLTDDLQVHILQLSKLKVTAQNVSSASPMEQWAYFLLNADKMTMEEVRRLFPDDVFTEAAGILEMISRTPEKRMEYDARLKYRMDEAGRMEQAGIEGEARGEARGLHKGQFIGQIRGFQMALGIEVLSEEELTTYDEPRLIRLADQLQQQIIDRLKGRS